MSKPRKPESKAGVVVEMEPVADENEETQADTPETATPTPAKPAPAAETQSQPRQRRSPTIFDRMANIPKPDWGKRAFLYIYCLEPICDLKMGGEKKYLVKLMEPIADEQPIMIDYGSGKYRLQLVYRKPAADQADQIDSQEIEIYNPKFPPKIPREVWMNDPRNKRWEALLPKEEPAQPVNTLGTINETFKTFSEIRKEMREELTPTAPAENPMATALSMAKDLLSMRAENPMVDVMRDQLNSLREEMKEQRQENRDLQAELRKGNAAPTDKADPLETVVKTIDRLQPLIDKIKPAVESVVERVSNGRRPRALDILLEKGLDVLGAFAKPVGEALAVKMMTPQGPPANGSAYTPAVPTPQNQPGIAAPAAPAQQPQPAQAQQKIIAFLSQPLVMSSLKNYFTASLNDQADGGDFANWVYDGVGEEPLKDARALGTLQILTMFKQSPQWPLMQTKEAELTEFIDEVLAWQPPAAENEDENETDLTAATM